MIKFILLNFLLQILIANFGLAQNDYVDTKLVNQQQQTYMKCGQGRSYGPGTPIIQDRVEIFKNDFCIIKFL